MSYDPLIRQSHLPCSHPLRWAGLFYMSGSVTILRFGQNEPQKKCESINRTNPQDDGHLDQFLVAIYYIVRVNKNFASPENSLYPGNTGGWIWCLSLYIERTKRLQAFNKQSHARKQISCIDTSVSEVRLHTLVIANRGWLQRFRSVYQQKR